MRRTGIDLSSTTCVVVDAERRRSRGGEGIRVHGIASMSSTSDSQGLVPRLEALIKDCAFPKRAWVNLWDVRSIHQYVLLSPGSPSQLESEVRRRAASALGLSESDVTLAMSIGSTRGEPGRPKVEVAFFAAPTQVLSERLESIEAAGFEVEGVTTPCGALWSQARLRRTEAASDVQAYVTLRATQSALAVFAGEFLLYARDLDWGYSSSVNGEVVTLERDDLAAKLSLEVRHAFLYLKQFWDKDVSLVLLSGDMPEIRSLTVPMIERLNVEVETLDTLIGYDLSSLPPGFSDHVAAFRMASGIAAAPSPANLLKAEAAAGRALSKWVLASAAAAAAALLAFSYSAQPAAVIEHQPAQSSRPVAEPEPRIHFDDLAAAKIGDPEPPPVEQAAEALIPTQEVETGDSGRSRIPNPQSLIPTESDHRVTGILFSDGRRLALIDRSVVGIGDRVGADTVREIEPDAVVLSNENGEERRLEFGTSH